MDYSDKLSDFSIRVFYKELVILKKEHMKKYRLVYNKTIFLEVGVCYYGYGELIYLLKHVF